MHHRWSVWKIELPEQDSDIKRSPDELRTQYLLFPDHRDVLVEGRDDARFFRNFLRDIGDLQGINYNVYAVNDRVNLPAAQVIEAGFEDGARGRLLTLSVIAVNWQDPERACLTCIVDADRAYVKNDLPISDVLLVTDYGGLECYALSPRVVFKFVAVVLRRDEPDANELINQALPFLNEIFCARAALHISDVGYGLDGDDIKRHSFSHGTDIAEALVSRALPQGRAGSEDLTKVRGILVDIRAALPADEPKKAVRGHDIAPLIINMLGLRNRWADASHVESALMGCVERADIEEFPLFKSLVARVISAAA